MFGKKIKKLYKKGEIWQSAIDVLDYPFYIIDINNYEIIASNKFIGIDLGDDREKYKCYSVTHRKNKPCNSKTDPCPIREVKRTRRPIIVDHIHFDKNGKPRSMEVHAYPIFNKKGEITHMVEYSIDISDRRKMEKETKKHAKELERMNSLMIGRELKMMELKEELKKLKTK